MAFDEFWWSSGAAGGGGDPGAEIAESLRFRGGGDNSSNTPGEFLQGPDPRPNGDFTYSVWWKRGDMSAGSPDNVPMTFLSFSDNQCYQLRLDQLVTRNGGSAPNLSDGVLRDPSAWYNCVWQNDGGTTTLFINGVQQATTQTTPNGNENMIIGCNTDQGDNKFIGYMADANFIDGLVVNPVDNFGRFNASGVWVPVDYPGAYGATGFHLEFENPQDLGNDTSGNDNDFTPNGFDTAPVGVFSNQIFTAPDQAAIPVNPTNQDFNTDTPGFQQNDAFNGDNSDGALSDEGAQSWIQFRPNTAIRAETSVVIRLSNTQTIAVNGVDTTLDQTTDQLDNVDISAALTFPVDLATVSIRGTELNNPRLCTIIVDGTELTDNLGANFDSMQDSPTQNYPTLNPLYISTVRVASNTEDANLIAKGGAVSTTIGLKPAGQEIYFEQTLTTPAETTATWQSWWNLVQLTNGPQEAINGCTTNAPPPYIIGGGFCYDLSANLFANNVDESQQLDDTANRNSVMGIRISDTNITITKNGEVTNVNNIAFANNFDEGMYIYFATASTGTEGVFWNFGQQPFQHRPAGLTDDNNLETQNIPTPTILNGSNHFRALTGTGANILAIAQGTNNTGTNWNPNVNTGFENGLWWIKDIVNDNQNQLVDSIDGDTSCRQLNAGTTGAYTAPGGTSIAWCWNWDQANPQVNGFNIVDFDVSGASVTLDTGLDNPEWIFYYSATSSNTFSGFRALGNGFLELNTSQVFLSGNTIQWQTGANAGEVILDGARISGAGKLFAWQSIPGYSAFGTYTANGQDNGPFNYTGFKPAFILIKSTTQGWDWFIWDTVRDPFNPANEVLKPSSTQEESAASSPVQEIDILSNGFKVHGDNQVNQPNQTHVWAAFAENPFGGENTVPVTAQ